jgi:amino acid transporter
MVSTWATEGPAGTPPALGEGPDLPQTLGYRLKSKFLGPPLTRDALKHERLSKKLALGVLSSDCISSSAYGTEEMLIVLLPAFGIAAFSLIMPLTAVILAVLTVVTLSYRDVVMIYTKTGGSYVVARENFGPIVAQVAAVALMLDYIVTLAVQAAAGTLAVQSAVPSLAGASWRIGITVAVILILFYGNLRGVREAGKTFAFPTYFFVISLGLVIVIGVVRAALGDLPHIAMNAQQAVPIGTGESLLSFAAIYALLRSFANGGSSLTGLEAVSNGVSVFKPPEGRNARRTLVVMSCILGFLVLGVSWLSHLTHAFPYEGGTPTVISQIAKDVLGTGFFGSIAFFLVQFATMLILWTGANTPFSGFPFLASFVAEDQFLPKQLTRRGHRLAFSNGIIVLTVVALALVLATRAQVDKLVAFYAIGVFTGFTFAGFGLAKYFATRREGNWRVKVAVNLTAGSVSALVVLIFAVVKFTEGAWLVILIFPIGVFALVRLHRQYQREDAALAYVGKHGSQAPNFSRGSTVVLVDGVDLAVIGAIRYARSKRPHDLRAVHFVIDDVHAEELRERWCSLRALEDVPLFLVDCPDRRLPRAALELAVRITQDPNTDVTLLLPRRTYSPILGRLLHDRTADEIARAVSRLPRVVATIIPFDVNGILNTRFAKKAAAAQAGTGPKARAGAKAPSEAAAGVAAIGELAVDEDERVPAGVGARQDTAESGNGDHPPRSSPVRTRAEALTPAVAGDGLSTDGAAGLQGRDGNTTPIGTLTWRQRATVEGMVRSVRVAPLSGAPSLQVELWDSTGGITLVFYGRRGIAGVQPGRSLRATGMVGELHGALAISNPVYQLQSG